jgi:predicted nucleotidyltransferase/shikimate kinase
MAWKGKGNHFLKVIVCGNINSGKSYCIDLLSKTYPDFSVIQIDEWRRKYSDGTLEGEKNAQQKFIDKVVNSENVFVELTGMGPLGKSLVDELVSKSFIVLYIKENVETCIERISEKTFSNTPYPKFNEKIDDTIIRLDKELQSGELHKLWKDKSLSFLEITECQKVLDIPVVHYNYFINVINKMINNAGIKEIIVYGSAARQNLTFLSDIDIFITTDYSVCDIERIFHDMAECDFSDTTGNKVVLFFKDIMVEIVVVKQIQDNIKYYLTSNIKDISASIIKGSIETYNEINKEHLNYFPDIKKLKEETIKRLIYFVLSLKKLAIINDDYKYFFHNNIIIHEITRLLYFNNNMIEYEYLPKNAIDIYGEINIKDLLYDFNKNKNSHIMKILEIIKKVLHKIGCEEKKYFEILNIF